MKAPVVARLAGLLAVVTLCSAGLARAGERPVEPASAYASLSSQPAPVRAAAAADASPALPAACAGQAWPHVDPACLTAAEGTPSRRAVRLIGLGR